MLILAMDANFRLCNKLCTQERGNPELGPGWAYFVPPEEYKHHIKNYVSEKDVSASILSHTLLLICHFR